MKRASVTFKFPAELAARLREVRLGAGLSQSQLAMLMGRTGKGAWTVVARLEKGRATYPSVGLLSDFLRGCRADFDAISDLLNEYCRQPVLPEQLALAQVTRMVAELPDKVAAEVTKYDLKTSLALRDKGRLARPDYSAMPLGKLTALRQEPAGQRLERVRKMANRVVVRRWLEQEMDRALDVYAHELQWGARLWMKSYGIKVFWIMKRTQTKPQAWRERQLERAWKRNFHSSGLSIPALRAMEQLAIELYEEVRALGVIDKLDKARPGEVEGMRPEPDWRRRRREQKEEAERFAIARTKVIEAASEAVRERMTAAGASEKEWSPACRVVRDVTGYALDVEPRSPKMAAWLDDLCSRSSDAGKVRALAEEALAVYEKYRHTIPARPVSLS